MQNNEKWNRVRVGFDMKMLALSVKDDHDPDGVNPRAYAHCPGPDHDPDHAGLITTTTTIRARVRDHRDHGDQCLAPSSPVEDGASASIRRMYLVKCTSRRHVKPAVEGRSIKMRNVGWNNTL